MNNKNSRKEGKMTIDKLAIMMNNSFERLEKKIDKDVGEVKETSKEIRKDILNILFFNYA